MDTIFKALADPCRRRLLDRLHERNGQTLRDLGGGLAMARQSVTKHLAVLEAAHLVTTVRRRTSFSRPSWVKAPGHGAASARTRLWMLAAGADQLIRPSSGVRSG